MFRARLRARLCRGKEGLHRAPTFVRQSGGYTHILLLFLSSTHYCPLFHPLLSEIYPLVTTLRPSKGGLKRQSLLQTWCGSAPRRGPSANGYDAWRFGSCGPGPSANGYDAWRFGSCGPARKRTKVDEKVDNSGWKIKIVAECGYTHPIVGRARWSPSFPRQSLARRRARNIVQVHAHALNGSWECYHVVKIGLGAIWCDHGRRRSLHFTTLCLKKGWVYPLCPFPFF